MVNPAGGRTTYTYDKKSGKISSITDAAGNRQMFRYNKMGELTEETDIRGNVTRYEYNVLGKLTSVTDGAGRTTRHYYLPGGRREKTVYPDGTQVSYEYDSLGRMKKRTGQNGYSISYSYDCMGRVSSVTSSTGQEKSYIYDIMGSIVSVTDANGNTTKYDYTQNGKLKEVTDALGNKTEYTYDKAGRLVYVCQHGQEGETDRTTEYERDAFGQVECVRDALGGEEHFRYDALGRMIEKRDREGLVTAYTYTADGRMENILYGDGRRAELEYTPLRQLAVVRDWLGETRIERDSHGMPASITDHNGRTVHYEWGSMGQRKGMIYPDGTRVSWTYDDLLRPAQMKRTAEGRETLWTDYKYDRQGRLSEKKSSGGYDTRWHYNETGLLEELCHADASGILDRFRYTYDAMGNRTMITKERRGLPEESGVYQYIYDGLQRLTGVEKDGKPLRSYQYDAFGNRTGMADHFRGTRSTYGYDALNHLLEQETWQGEDSVIHKKYTYDKRGNLTGEYQDGGLLHGYVYDSMNRLQRAWDSQGEEAEYFYNALGHRTGRSAGGQMEEYLLDLTKPYHNLLELCKGEHRQTFYWDMNVSAMEDENRIIQYCLSDELGSPLRVLYRNENGEAYGYDEFGVDLYDPEREQYTGKSYCRQGERQPFGYTGYRYDDISGTYFAQAREYQPVMGRFVAEDVIHDRNTVPKTLNRYGYCWGNPMQYVDLNGEDPITVMIIIGLAVAAALGTTGCGAEFDEEKRVPLPTTFSDYEYEHDLDEYNSKEYKKYTNCYAYALDIVVDPITGEKFRKHDGSDKWAAQPGMFSDSQNIWLGSNKATYITKVENDMKKWGWSIQEYDENLTGGYIVALALDLSLEWPDYHFYRENGDGTWSCKWAQKDAVTGILDPQVDAFEHGYEIFCGYYYVIKECE